MNFEIKSSFGEGNIQALTTVKQVHEINNLEEITFDLTDYAENNPFNNLIIACSLINYRDTHPMVKCKLKPKTGGDDFLGHLGFYDMIGIDIGKKIGQARASTNYVPIQKIDFDSCFYTAIENKAKQLAELLKFDSNLSSFLEYAFVETIRNVYEHAETNTVFICAQKWPSKHLVEIAIVDMGCGIVKTLNKSIKDMTEEEIIQFATEPGVSARSNHTYLDKDDSWRNSGYGLYALRELAKEYTGSFLLCSKNRALKYTSNDTEKFKTYFDGTAIAIRIRTNTGNDFSQIRNKIIRQGEVIAKDMNESIKRASKSSGGQYK